MVNIDNVYQKVLALANKEQRGYITPQEFNLFANQAQLEIFEQYFYDINQFGRTPGNENEYGDILNLLNEKISEFKTTTVLPYLSNVFTKPNDLYRLGTVWYSATTLLTDGVEIQEITTDELLDIVNSPLTTPTVKNPVYVDGAAGLTIYPTIIISGVTASYITLPTPPRWGYVVVSEKAMFDPDPARTTHFELHPAEETDLVYKILKYAGISMDKDSIMRAGQGMEISKVSQEKQ